MISIVTITYNNYEDLVKTLKSIPQSSDIESVIINGGDEKRTIDYLEFYNGKVINEKDNGIADAFNKGIHHSTGDAVMFLNSGDELLDADYIKNALEAFNGDKEAGFVHSNLLFVDKVGGELVMRPLIKNSGRGMPFNHPTMIVKKWVFQRIGGFSQEYKIAMDFDFALRMEKEGIRGIYIDTAPVVKMDGRGRSAINEGEAILECYRALKNHSMLNGKRIPGLITRVTLYLLRKVTPSFLLKPLKKIKHSY